MRAEDRRHLRRLEAIVYDGETPTLDDVAAIKWALDEINDLESDLRSTPVPGDCGWCGPGCSE